MMGDDIAIIGIGMRFPGDATSAEKFWKIISLGESEWSEIPSERLNIGGYYHPSGNRQGSISFRGGHFLKCDISAFDASFFSITSEEAEAMDPQQRMLLEVCYEAFENAGLKKENIDGGDTAVYIGSFVKDYEQICLRDPDWQPKYAATGNGMAIMANRISYAFNLHGPSMTIDTGCSGSLVSVHSAAQSLRAHETSMAVAGGVGLILTPSTIMPMTALNFLSPDGKCFTFDSRANGYGRGEGVGLVVMKRLSDAIRDGDPIRAVIRGSHVNQDGKTAGITLPSQEAQIANIQTVYRKAGLNFDQTAYVECHGTGTPAGDWRELKAISETLASGRNSSDPVIVGSVKPNIGHLEGAAGIAGLIKSVLMVEHGKIPPNINFESGHPRIDFDGWKVPTELLAWPKQDIRRVSVNCFGFGGTNAHVILDEAPRSTRGQSPRQFLRSYTSLQVPGMSPETRSRHPFQGLCQTPRLFCYSSHDKEGISRTLKSHLQHLESQKFTSEPRYMRDYAYTLACRRSMLEWRAAFVADTAPQLIAGIQAFDHRLIQRRLPGASHGVCFLFGGQGTQWPQMGKDLMRFERFRLSIWEASHYLRVSLGSSYDLLEEILRTEVKSRLSEPEISQPAITVIQVALVELLASTGVRPTHVVGHSSGEIAAAFAAGALSRENAWEVAYYRGLVTTTLPILAPKLKGAMIVVGMSQIEAKTYLKDTHQSAQVACVNSSHSTTLSGLSASIKHIANDLKQRNIFHRILDVNVAYHSSHMKLIEPDYKALLRHIIPRNMFPGIKMFSSVTGMEVTGKKLGASYWARNMVSPVQFMSAIESMMNASAGNRPIFILELSPLAALRTPTLDTVSNIAPELLKYHSVMGARSRGADMFLKVLGDMWCYGFGINMNAVMAHGTKKDSFACLTDLPPYSWNHDRSYWHESHLDKAIRFRGYPRQDLIGAPTPDSTPFERRWRGFLRISENPWLQDHQIERTIIYPAAGIVCMVLEAARQIASVAKDVTGYDIMDMAIDKAMVVPDTLHGLEITLHLRVVVSDPKIEQGCAPLEFAMYSKPLDKPWERHATGRLQLQHQTADLCPSLQSHIGHMKELTESCQENLMPRQLYEQLDGVGINYGPVFRNIVKIRKHGDSCVSEVRVPDTQACMPCRFEYPHLIHPATLDSMFQTLFSVRTIPMVPTFIRRLSVSANVTSQRTSNFRGYATARESGTQGAEGTFFMVQRDSSASYVHARGIYFTMVPFSKAGFLPHYHNLCSEIVWGEDTLSLRPTTVRQVIEAYAHKHPSLRVLQMGGCPSLTEFILSIVAPTPDTTPALSRYTLAAEPGTDPRLYVPEKIESTVLREFVETIEINNLNVSPGYHIILASATATHGDAELWRYLRPGGVLMREQYSVDQLDHARLENTVPPRAIDCAAQTMSNVPLDNASDAPLQRLRALWKPQEPSRMGRNLYGVVLLMPIKCTLEMYEFAAGLRMAFTSSQVGVDVSEMHMDNASHKVPLVSGSIVVSLLDMASENSIYVWEESDFSLFKSIYNAAEGLVWITRGANKGAECPKASPIVSLARTLLSENPLKTMLTIDLSIRTSLAESYVIDNILRILTYSFGPTSTGENEPRDTEFSLEANKIFIPRLRPITSLNRAIEAHDHSILETRSFTEYQSRGLGLRLDVAPYGSQGKTMHFLEFDHTNPTANEVEVLFEAAPLTAIDIDILKGRSEQKVLGMDLYGRIGRVGDRVTGFQSGERVCALVADGVFRNAINLRTNWVKRYQEGFIPSLHVCAFYGLIHIGRITTAKKVLVHFGASAAGLAAVDISLLVGAEVFATVGLEDAQQQRSLLLAKGLSEDHILEANFERFVEVILFMTGGEGVDSVYNTVEGHTEAVARCVRSCGSVIYPAAKSHPPSWSTVSLNAATIVGLDLQRLVKTDPQFVGDLLEQTVRLVSNHPLDSKVTSAAKTDFGLQSLEAALEHIERLPNVGYATVTAISPHEDQVLVLKEPVHKSLRGTLDANGTYVLVGGLGGLGRSIATLLVDNGARNLAFISRSGVSKDGSRPWMTDLQNQGVITRVCIADICDADMLKSVVEEMSAMLPPVRGVFQCAAVVKDAVFENMTWYDWTMAFRPKTLGTWNIVQTFNAAAQEPFFIFLASSAGVIGNRGQANYAAGNCFLDTMAKNLRLRGKRAVSIDLGPVLGAGMLTEDEKTLDMLRGNGFYGIRHEDFLRIVTHSITMEILPGIPMPPQVVLGVGTGGIFHQNNPADPYWFRTALYSYLSLVDMPPPNLSLPDSAPFQRQGLRAQLSCCADESAARKLIIAGLVGLLAKSMTMLPEEVDTSKSPTAYGVDSLVAVGIRNWVLSNCTVQISVFEVLGEQTIAELAALIAIRGGHGQPDQSKIRSM